jgi:hypothetical protein
MRLYLPNSQSTRCSSSQQIHIIDFYPEDGARHGDQDFPTRLSSVLLLQQPVWWASQVGMTILHWPIRSNHLNLTPPLPVPCFDLPILALKGANFTFDGSIPTRGSTIYKSIESKLNFNLTKYISLYYGYILCSQPYNRIGLKGFICLK